MLEYLSDRQIIIDLKLLTDDRIKEIENMIEKEKCSRIEKKIEHAKNENGKS